MTYATDTHDEKPAFVPERELHAALAEARTAARQRDELAAENARLKRETDEVRGPDAHVRRAAILREALQRKDQEILGLKDHAMARERQLAELRESAAALRREVAAAETRVRTATTDDDRQRAATAAELVRATAQCVSLTQERDALARRLESAVPMETARARESELWERLRAAEEAVEAAESRLTAARETHAIALRTAEDDHAEELAALREALTASERRVQGADARYSALGSRYALVESTLAAERAAHAEALAAARAVQEEALAAARVAQAEAVAVVRAELETARGEFEAEVSALRKVCERAVEAAAGAAAAQTRAESEAQAARERLDRAVAEAVEAAEQRAEETVKAAHEAYGAELSALRGAHGAEAAAMEDAHGREIHALQQVADGHANRADAEAERAAGLQRALDKATADKRDLAADLEAARAALTDQVRTGAERLEAAEKAHAETAAYRDRYARRLAAAMEQVRATRRDADRASEGLAVEARALSTLVGRLTARWVMDGARVSAFQAGRLRPDAGDVDEALSWVADEVPEPVAEELWAARDALLARCLNTVS